VPAYAPALGHLAEVDAALGARDTAVDRLRPLAMSSDDRDIEPGTGGREVTLPEPHQAASEVESGHGERRNPPVPAPCLDKQALRLRDPPVLGLEHGQRTQRGEVGPTLRRVPA
jgi:hypothetical protein